MAQPVDPVRDSVEATLQRLVGFVATSPCAVVRAAGRTISESIGLARTIVTLTVDGLLGWEVDAGVPPLPTSDSDAARPAAPRVIEPVDDSTRATAIADDGGVAGDLAIPGYEDLAASHIVARLDRLTPADLAEIRMFEIANRGRRTVVGKIDQLLARA